MSNDDQVSPGPAAPVRLSFSHIGFYVQNLPRMLDFYTHVLGFTVTDRGKIGANDVVFTSWDAREHHQIVLVSGRAGSLDLNHLNQLSFRVASIEDLQALWRRVKDEPGVSDLRPTNHGNAWSVYFRDPEGNRIEIFCDTEWYITQPCIEPLDIALPADELRRRSDAFCRAAPGFRPVAEFRAEVAEKIARHAGAAAAK